MIERLARIAELRDIESSNHIVRVGLYSSAMAREMGLPVQFINAIGTGAMTHDIGNIGIPDTIVFNNGQLSAADYEVMKLHTVIGEKVLAGGKSFGTCIAASIALNHHEKWDGTGYPNGLRGKDIPIEARIVKLADTYDVLRSTRSFEGSMSHNAACTEILEGGGETRPEHFDPEILQIFKKVAASFDDIFTNGHELLDETFGKIKNMLKWFACRM